MVLCACAIGLFIALLVMAPPATAQQTSPAASVDEGRWPYALPFLADEAVKRGYELPLPRGLSALIEYGFYPPDVQAVAVGLTFRF